MDEQRKHAYRQLLYWAMLDIRGYCQSRDRPSINPFRWYRQYRHSRHAGAIADWLHNLADQASMDFSGFDENAFWETHAYFCGRFPNGTIPFYRQRFEEYLK